MKKDPISHVHQELMNQNKEHIENMLDLAILQLVEIAEDNDIWLINDGHVCKNYEDIFDCLKHWSQKKMEKNK